MTMPADVFHDRLQQPPPSMRALPSSHTRTPPRGPVQRLREDQQWPNPWMRRHWDAAHPLDLNKPLAQRPAMAVDEAPNVHTRSFRPAFHMDVNALVKSLWTPPKPKRIETPVVNQPVKLTRHRSGSPPRSVYPAVHQPQRAVSSRGHSHRTNSAEEAAEHQTRRRAYPSTSVDPVRVRLEHYEPPRSRRMPRRYSPEADPALSIPHDEVTALIDLFDALGGDKWRRRDGWKQPTVDPETWFGVEVSTGHVVAIELPANELHGKLPASIEKLSQLRVLDLSKNRIHDQLQDLYLHQNALTGSLPSGIGNLHQLRTLQLQHNILTGLIPDSICDLTKLTKLSLRGNCLSGPIPRDIGRLSSLVFLSLRNNELNGTIPESIGQCKSLEFLNLSSNQLSGSIPDTISELEDLEYLYLFDNALEGCVPGSISRLKYLKESDFRDNRLKGELPNFLDGCSSLDAVMSKWKNRKASYRHAILGDPIPLAPSSNNQVTSKMFLTNLESTPHHSSSLFMHPTFDFRKDSCVEDDFSGPEFVMADLARKLDASRPKAVSLEHELTPVEAS
ncbi:hypothetical protein P43SY_000260 [Pythium insidiosum]|uniref:L domain-like protein n=1 Tax=Pythium insidiosum TaxID=114742 RepID=A0AAD5LPX5_PYTIN|nr:hypothetical protein P43SY_000260 [Pythium insidiosum]